MFWRGCGKNSDHNLSYIKELRIPQICNNEHQDNHFIISKIYPNNSASKVKTQQTLRKNM